MENKRTLESKLYHEYQNGALSDEFEVEGLILAEVELDETLRLSVQRT